MGGQSDELFMLLADCQDSQSSPPYIIPLILFLLCPMSVLSAVACFLYRLGANGGSEALKQYHSPLARGN